MESKRKAEMDILIEEMCTEMMTVKESTFSQSEKETIISEIKEKFISEALILFPEIEKEEIRKLTNICFDKMTKEKEEKQKKVDRER